MLASFIHGFSSNDQLNILNRNKEILRYLSYLESLLNEHEATTIELSQSSSSRLWSLLDKYQLTDDILNQQKELLELGALPTKEVKGDLDQIQSDAALIQHLKWSQLKILRLIQINQVIHYQIKNIERELNRAIENA